MNTNYNTIKPIFEATQICKGRIDDNTVAYARDCESAFVSKDNKEEQLKKVNTYIKENDIEVDKENSDYVYFYKPTDLDGTADSNKFVYTVGKSIVKDNIPIYTYNKALAIKKCKSISYAPGLTINFTGIQEPINPSVLKKETFKLFKVKVNKNNIIISDCNIVANEFEIVEEIDLSKAILEYKALEVNEEDGKYVFVFEVRNNITGANIKVTFNKETVNLTQKEIKTKIKDRLKIIQKIYDKYTESNGILD